MAARCEWCGGEDAVGTCPRAVTCPTCQSGPGSPCYRPSGHRAARLHATRIALAEGAATPAAAPAPIQSTFNL